MNIVFYVFMTLAAVYVVLHIRDAFNWYYNIILIVPKGIWNLIKNIFGK